MPGTYEGRIFMGKFLKNDYTMQAKQAYTHAIVLDWAPEALTALAKAKAALLAPGNGLPVQAKQGEVEGYLPVFHFSTKAPASSPEGEAEARALFEKARVCLEKATKAAPLGLSFGPPGLRLDRQCNQDVRVIASPSEGWVDFLDPFLAHYLAEYHPGGFPSACQSEEILTLDRADQATSRLYVLPSFPLLPTPHLNRQAEGALLTWLKAQALPPLGPLPLQGLRLLAQEKKPGPSAQTEDRRGGRGGLPDRGARGHRAPRSRSPQSRSPSPQGPGGFRGAPSYRGAPRSRGGYRGGQRP